MGRQMAQSGFVLAQTLAMIGRREVDWEVDDIWAALVDDRRLVDEVRCFGDIADAVVSRPIPVPERSVREIPGGSLYAAGRLIFEPFALGEGNLLVVYQRAGRLPVLYLQPGIAARPNAGPVRINFPHGAFTLWTQTPKASTTRRPRLPSTASP